MNWKEELKWQKGQLLAIIIPTSDDFWLAGFAAALTSVGIACILAAHATVNLVIAIVE